MAIAVSIPYAAAVELRRLIYPRTPGGFSSFVPEFLRQNNLTDVDIRRRAQVDSTTITEAFRKRVVAVYPQIEEVWPPRAFTANQILGIARRSRSPDDTDELKKALQIIAAMVKAPHDMRVRNRALRMLERYGVQDST